MSAYEWMSQTASGNDVPPASEDMQDEQEATVAGLNFMSAIDAHMKWKMRLESRLQGDTPEQPEIEAAGRDDRCALGHWIHGAGAERFGDLSAFADMQAGHARFHECAGGVLAACRDGDRQGARDMLEHGDYARASRQVTILLARLYVQIAEAEGSAGVDGSGGSR